MSLNEPRPGLRVINKSHSVSKVTVHVAAGDELEVSEDVAAQIAAQNGDFVAVGSDDAAKAVPYPPVVEVEADQAEPEKRPAKRGAKKRPA